jgi:hypothetical protein
MGILQDFPTDPFTPSLRYAATCQVPIWMPWASESIKLGTSLAVARGNQTTSHFMDKDKTAFSRSSLQRSQLVFTSSSSGDVSSAETFGAASASEHVNFTISGQIGGSFAGAKGRANYEKSATNSNSVSN